jgi:HAE1 family hydrophobic/amphiphilic exporter-1
MPALKPAQPGTSIFMSRLSILLLTVTVALHSAAGAPPVYTLDDCLRIGHERAATLHNARLDEAIAETKIGQVRSQVIPQAGLNASYHRLGDPPSTFEDGESARLDNYSVNAEATQLLYAGGKIRTALDAARLYRDASSYATRAAAATLTRDIHRGFHQVRLTSETALVATQSVAQLRLLLAQTEQKFAQGVLSEFEMLSARVRLANEIPNWIEARNRHELAKASFANLLHLDGPDFELAGEPAYPALDPALDALTALALEKRPELAVLARRVDLHLADIEVEKSGRIPELHGFVSYNGNNPDFYQPAEDAWEWSWMAGVRMSWKPFDGGLRSALVRQKTAEWEKSSTDFSELKNDIRLQVRQAWLTWRHAIEALEGARENVSLAEQAQAIAGVRQDQGLATYLEFTESNLALSTARLTLFRAQRLKAVAETEILYACGLLTEPIPPPEAP